MHLFVAIEIPREIRERIAEFVTRSQAGFTSARWVRPEGLHVTLKFLGNVAEARRGAIEAALSKVEAPRFKLSLRNIGVFPNPRSPRVLWIGIECGSELRALAKQIDDALVSLGFEPEKRAFTPHVTLARFKEGSRTASLSSALPETNSSFGTMTATEFHLYESKLSPKGASYSKLSSFVLK